MTEADKTQTTVSFAAEIFPSLSSQVIISEPEMKMLAAVNASKGLVTISEALTLYRLCKQLPAGARILEIGSYLGASTTAIGHAIFGRGTELYCLDCWHDYEAHGWFDQPRTGTTHAGNEVLLKFLKTTEFLNEQLRILKGTTEQFRALLPTSFFDLIFIDAGHEYKDVINDLITSLKTLTPGGLLLGHDYHSDGHGVVAAVNQIIYESQSITIKGLIPGSSIWYAVVPDPIKELGNMNMSGQPNGSGKHD